MIGEEDWIDDEAYATPQARLLHLKPIFARIEQWTMTKTKFEAMDILNKYDIPCGPILSMKEIADEPSLRDTGTVVEVDHPTRGKYLTVGNPIKMSDSPTEVTRSPLLGEHTDEVLAQLGYSAGRRGRDCAPSGAGLTRRATRRTDDKEADERQNHPHRRPSRRQPAAQARGAQGPPRRPGGAGRGAARCSAPRRARPTC